MSGHSKWATTKHKKADHRLAPCQVVRQAHQEHRSRRQDGRCRPRRATRPSYDAVQKAKKTSVPNDNIDRAIKRGAGLTGESIDYTTIMYEGYGPNGVALLIECLTDNKNRAAAEVRTAMTRNGGTMADPGSVAYNFHRKGVIVVSGRGHHRGRRHARGARRRRRRGQPHAATASRSSPRRPTWSPVRTALQEAGIDYESADVEFVPNLKVEVDADTARKVFRLIDALEDSDDVQNVYSNFDLTAEVQAELEADEE